MMSKCRAGIAAEYAVMEVTGVGGRTRTRDGDSDAAADDEAPVMDKRRKLANDRHVRLRNSQTPLQNPVMDYHNDRASTSCSGSSKRIQFVDLEDTSVEVATSTYYSCRERREEEASCWCSEVGGESESESEELDSKAEKSEANSRPRSTVEKMPTEDEIEQFFAKAEKQLQKEFAEKYNYDIEKDEPMEGRYEWIRLKATEEN
uniref:Cyclin-dependent kinase inhibitor n=1 Tax=Dimocarpus longan TaxID=128017 RepID=A0A8G0QX61_9ROSI|nr:cyclin-dependent kinase inhibitor 3 [Dimocarpus longan]